MIYINVISASRHTLSVAMSRSSTAVHQTATSNGWQGLFPRRLWNVATLLTKFDSQTLVTNPAYALTCLNPFVGPEFLVVQNKNSKPKKTKSNRNEA